MRITHNWVERSVGRFRTGVEEETRHRCPMSALSPRRRRRSGGGSRQMAPDGVPPRSRMSHTHFTASVLSYELRSLLDVSAIVCDNDIDTVNVIVVQRPFRDPLPVQRRDLLGDRSRDSR